ncbi:MAG: ATP-binding protein [Bdellovibrionales bacterium]
MMEDSRESRRLQALYDLKILDTDQDHEFNELTKVLSDILETPIAFICLMDAKRQWFKSSIGLNGVQDLPRENTICQHVVDTGDMVVVTDASQDSRVANCPLVRNAPHIRFYAGAPLFVDDGMVIGTLSVADLKPRELNPSQVELIENLSRHVVHLMRLRSLLEEVRNEKSKFEIISEHLGDVIWMTDPRKQSMAYISRAYEYVWERSCESLYAKPFSFVDAIVEEDRQRMINSMPKQLEGTYDERYRIRTPTGIVKWIHDRAYPIYGASGEVEMVVGIATDITQQKEMDELMDTQRQKMILSERFTSLGEMAGGIAHEINNPLSIILLRAQVLLEKLETNSLSPEDMKSGLEKISGTAQRIARIVKSMRTFARDSTNDPYANKDIWEIVEDTLEFVKFRYKQAEVDLRVCEPVHTKLECRPSEIGQVLMNLLTNALDASREFPNPWVQLDVLDQDNWLEVRVTDCGNGIPRELFYKIWDPFFTTKEVDKGNGLGLSVSRALIERHGGTLNLDLSCENTRFVARIPKSHKT